MRTQYNTAIKEIIKKSTVSVKKDGKNPQKRAIYDFDGSLIEPVKSDVIRFPTHFVDLDVNVENDEKINQTSLGTPFLQRSFKRILKNGNTRH